MSDHPGSVTLLDVLTRRGAAASGGLLYTFLADDGTESEVWTATRVDATARRIARSLQALGLSGERALILGPTCGDYVAAFFGCLYAGTVAVPMSTRRSDADAVHLAAVASDTEARGIILTGPQRAALRARYAPHIAHPVEWIEAPTVSDQPDDGLLPIASPESLAYLQYTSGSTSEPRGVEISHRALMANERMIQQAFNQDERSIVVGWLPLYHDMGLVGTVLQPLFCGGRAILMSPAAFVRHPARWLSAISRYRGTTSGAPDFGYDLCVRRVTDAEKAGLDLSSWTVAFNGSEPIRQGTLNRFSAAFASCGFRSNAFVPCYGLAEATLLVASSRDGLALGHGDADSRAEHDVVCCGSPADGQTVAIVEPETAAVLGEATVGEICVSGPSIASGYWRQPELTEATFGCRLPAVAPRPFLRTGDLGFLRGGRLFVCGRLKDLVIVRGSNHYPQDIEYTSGRSHPDVVPGGAAAFALDRGDGERLAIVQEIARGATGDLNDVVSAIRRDISRVHEIAADEIVLVKEGRVPRTTSGKPRRGACRSALLDGQLSVLRHDGQTRPLDGVAEVIAWSSVVAALDEERPALARRYVDARVAQALAVRPAGLPRSAPLPALGLDSMRSLELQAAIEQDTGPLPPGWFGSATLEVLDRYVIDAACRAGRGAIADARPADDPSPSDSSRLSVGQQALWYLERLSGTDGLLNIAAALRLRGTFDPERLRHAFQVVVDRHPSLRMNVVETGRGPESVVRDAYPVDFREVDGSGWTDERILQFLGEETRVPFDLANDALLRVRLIERASVPVVLLLIVHHQVCDLWSLWLLFDELDQVYRGRSLPPPPRVRYQQFVAWQVEFATSAAAEALWQRWRAEFSPLPESLDLPCDGPRPTVQTFRGGVRHFHIAGAAAERLAMIARDRGTTMYVVLLAAFQVLLYRYTGRRDFLVGSVMSGRSAARWRDLVGYLVSPIVLRATIDDGMPFASLIDRVGARVLSAHEYQVLPLALLIERLGLPRDPQRQPLFDVMFALQQTPRADPPALALCAAGVGNVRLDLGGVPCETIAIEPDVSQFDLSVVCAEGAYGISGSVQYNVALFSPVTIEAFTDHFVRLAATFAADVFQRVDVPMQSERERQSRVRWTCNEAPFTPEPIHRTIERVAASHPDARAVLVEDVTSSFQEVNQTANRLAHRLLSLGVRRGSRVGLILERSRTMPSAMLAVLKAGAAYVPVDPASPRERLLAAMTEAGVSVAIVSPSLMADWRSTSLALVCETDCAGERVENPDVAVSVDDTAYVMYTSGSTGTPKGVVVSHRNVSNFFLGMDQRVGCGPSDLMLAVSSITFDISVLELLWTLSRGCAVVVADVLPVAPRRRRARTTPLDYSLFYFAQDADAARGKERYRLLLEGARQADARGYAAVWTPERHFHAFGGLYPNPSVIGAALAMITSRVAIRAGSVVLPLHDPIRVAEEWALVDNLSGGRVGVAFASGWHADDFALAPERYPDRKEVTWQGIERVRRLWRGDAVQVKGGGGKDVHVRIHPQPVQRELPIWITAAGSEETFRIAGRLGANLLTHLLGQSLEDVERSVRLYRSARAEAGHDPDHGVVTLMVHTYVGRDDDEVRAAVRGPMRAYLATAVDLVAKYTRTMDLSFDPAGLAPADRDALLDHAFDRYYEGGSLLGSVRRCRRIAGQIHDAGVDEIACLIDFGLADERVLAGLDFLDEVRMSSAPAPSMDFSLAAQARRLRPTLMQCTPSLLQMLLADDFAPFASIRTLLVGGESMPETLPAALAAVSDATLMNMYGPTETTIWSSTCVIDRADGPISIGAPIANTALHVLDGAGQLAAHGAIGELVVGGLGVAGGYVRNPRLTAARFVPDAWSGDAGGRLYRTGDMVRARADGALTWIRRADDQIKIRGHRVELGDVEAALLRCPGIRQAAVVARPGNAGLDLAAYVVRDHDAGDRTATADALRERLPQFMIPSAIVELDALPRRTSGKIDRQALLALPVDHPASPPASPPKAGLEQIIAEHWRRALGRDEVGVDQNFFDVGGHSLLMAHVHIELQARLSAKWPLVKMLEFPTIASLARYLEGTTDDRLSEAAARARKHRAALESRAPRPAVSRA